MVPPFQMDSTIDLLDHSMAPALQPRPENPDSLGYSAFARRYLRNRFFFLLLQVREMFQFPGFATYAYVFSVCQFGYLRIKVRLTTPRRFSQFSAPFKAF